MVQESYIAKIKREAQEKKELAKATTKATTKENSPPAKDAGGRSRAPGSEGYKPAKDTNKSPYNSTKTTTTTKKNTKAKAPIVTKKQLKDSGFTNLRDYLNDKRGLTRREDKPKSTIESQDAKPNKSNAQRPDFTPKPVDKKVEPKKVETKKVEPKKVTRNSSTIDKIKKTMGIGRKRTAKEDMGYELQNKARASMGMKKGGNVKKYKKGGSIDGCAVRGHTRAKRSR